MRNALSALLGLALVVALVAGLRAEDKNAKKVTLEGTITCAKCDLKVEGQKACHTVIKVKEDDKDVVYYFDKDSSKKYHEPICKEAKEGKVTGTVSEKDGKKYVKVSKLDWKE
jgi:hypothetical protein